MGVNTFIRKEDTGGESGRNGGEGAFEYGGRVLGVWMGIGWGLFWMGIGLGIYMKGVLSNEGRSGVVICEECGESDDDDYDNERLGLEWFKMNKKEKKRRFLYFYNRSIFHECNFQVHLHLESENDIEIK